jgi:Histidine kinase-, DNA gyrase B-, and HSP90-like ATPase./Histidine kinase.
MLGIIDRLILLLSCTILYMITIDASYAIIPFLIVVFLCCLSIYINRNFMKLGIYILYLLICTFWPGYLLFLPVMLYDILFTEQKIAIAACVIPVIANPTFFSSSITLFLLIFIIFALQMKYKSNRISRITEEYNAMRDTAEELSRVQEEKNRSLLENQDYEINVATLNERNRISKEIHDHIGHLLSRSLLQIGALLTITKEEVTREGLTVLKDSISGGMDSIRASIHNMHDESIDLYAEIEKLIKEFTLCPVSLEYDITAPPLLKIKYCFIAIVKESLSNIVKHSDATLVTIILKEEPAMYQLIISDNGHIDDKTKVFLRRFRLMGENADGMGLQNISDRIKGFHGNLNITGDHGFKLFITIPKEGN